MFHGSLFKSAPFFLVVHNYIPINMSPFHHNLLLKLSLNMASNHNLKYFI